MTSQDLINSIISKYKAVETYEKGKLIHSERNGWITAKQSAFLISLMQKEGYEENWGFAFSCGNFHVMKPVNNGSRAFRYIERYL